MKGVYRFIIPTVLAVLFPVLAHGAALGVTPPTSDFGIIQSGTVRTGEFILVKSEDDVTVVNLRAIGDGAEFVYMPDSIEFVDGQRLYEVQYEVAPDASANGEYTVVIEAVPEVTETGTVNSQQVVAGVQLSVAFESNTNATISYQYRFNDFHQSENTVDASFFIENTGEAVWKPSEISFSLETETGVETDTVVYTSDDIEAIDPGSHALYAVEFENTDPNQQYTVVVDVMKDGAHVIHENMSATTIEVLPTVHIPNMDEMNVTAVAQETIQQNRKHIMLALGLLFIFIATLLAHATHKRRAVLKKEVHKPTTQKKKNSNK